MQFDRHLFGRCHPFGRTESSRNIHICHKESTTKSGKDGDHYKEEWEKDTYTFVGSPEGSGYISAFLFSLVSRLFKSLTKSTTSFPASDAANSRREAQKYVWARNEDADKSHNSSCSITWPLIWFRVNLERILTTKSPPIRDLGFPVSVHLMLSKLVDNITISCTLWRKKTTEMKTPTQTNTYTWHPGMHTEAEKSLLTYHFGVV